ncbi:MAG: hypothetical protein GOU98_00170 [Candidatus Altiarchaeota archaeon]|nr:hypothetical protein [Candidatus Altiarchaeota archaeon]
MGKGKILIFFVVLAAVFYIGIYTSLQEKNDYLQENNTQPLNDEVIHGSSFTNPNHNVVGKSVKAAGRAELVDAADDVAVWLSNDKNIQVVSLVDAVSPSVVGTLITSGYSESTYQDGMYLYLIDGTGLRITPVSDPFGEPVGTLDFTSDMFPKSIAVANNYAYFIMDKVLAIYSLEDIARPVAVSSVPIVGIGGGTVKLYEGYAYVGFGIGGLNIVDVRDSKNPVVVNFIPFESHILNFEIKGDYLYLSRIMSVQTADNNVGYLFDSVFEVYDLSIPSSPILVDSISVPTNLKGLSVSGNYAYLTGSHPHRFTVVDISSPSNLEIENISSDIISGTADLQGIITHNEYAYIIDSVLGLKIIDITNPLDPVYLKDFDLHGRATTISSNGGVIYVSVEQKFFNVADISDPDNPILAYSKRYDTSSQFTGIVIRDKKAYFNGEMTVQIYDLSDPYNPIQLNEKYMAADGVAVSGNYFYTVIGEIGLIVYDVTNPTNPKEVSRTDFLGMPRDLTLNENWVAAVSNKPFATTLLDISNSQNPVVTDSVIFDEAAWNIRLNGGYLYVAQGPKGLDIFEIGPTGSLTFSTNFFEGYSIGTLALSENRMYLVDSGVIKVFDNTNPLSPLLLNQINTQVTVNQMVFSDGYLYVADGDVGLTVVPV